MSKGDEPEGAGQTDEERATATWIAGAVTSAGPTDEMVEAAAKAALFEKPAARTGIVNPVNGSRPYSYVEFLGKRVEFQQSDSAIRYHNGPPVYDAATDKAAVFATAINNLLFDVGKDAARAALSAQPARTSGDELLREALRAWRRRSGASDAHSAAATNQTLADKMADAITAHLGGDHEE